MRMMLVAEAGSLVSTRYAGREVIAAGTNASASLAVRAGAGSRTTNSLGITEAEDAGFDSSLLAPPPPQAVSASVEHKRAVLPKNSATEARMQSSVSLSSHQ
jgi:hypothetical protein